MDYAKEATVGFTIEQADCMLWALERLEEECDEPEIKQHIREIWNKVRWDSFSSREWKHYR